MKQYKYHGYIIKQVKRRIGFGLEWAIYKDNELIAYADRERIAKDTADWHQQYNN